MEEHHISFISVGQYVDRGDPHHALGNGVSRGDEERHSRLVVKTLIPG